MQRKASRADSVVSPFRKRSRGIRLLACKRAHKGSAPLPTFCGAARDTRDFLQQPQRALLPLMCHTWRIANRCANTSSMHRPLGVLECVLFSEKSPAAPWLLVCKRVRNAPACSANLFRAARVRFRQLYSKKRLFYNPFTERRSAMVRVSHKRHL